MGHYRYTELKKRALLRITGEEAKPFLHGLVTCDIEHLTPGEMNFGALLTPQGKILFDFFIVRSNDGYIIDLDKSMMQDFVQRLTFYRLRAKVIFEPMDPRTHVFAIWNTDRKGIKNLLVDGIYANDPRHSELAVRAYLRRAPHDAELTSALEYKKWRIAFGMPHGGKDYVFGDAFPHEALMDQFDGVDFKKGCYIGQEVVSRMQHRGTARKRFIQIASTKDEALPVEGTDIIIANRTVGQITSAVDNIGLALVRLDKAGDAVRTDTPIYAGTKPVTLKIQDWVSFAWP